MYNRLCLRTEVYRYLWKIPSGYYGCLSFTKTILLLELYRNLFYQTRVSGWPITGVLLIQQPDTGYPARSLPVPVPYIIKKLSVDTGTYFYESSFHSSDPTFFLCNLLVLEAISDLLSQPVRQLLELHPLHIGQLQLGSEGGQAGGPVAAHHLPLSLPVRSQLSHLPGRKKQCFESGSAKVI